MQGARGRALVAAVTLASLLGGCGSDEPDETAAAPERHETVDELQLLPGGWEAHVNHRAGFAVGIPPGWTVKRVQGQTRMTSPDELAVVQISADRTEDALSTPLDEFARTAMDELSRRGGFREFEAGDPEDYVHPYEAAAVRAKARSQQGVLQNLLFVVLRREKLATYTVLAARNAEVTPGLHASDVEKIVASIRGRPVG